MIWRASSLREGQLPSSTELLGALANQPETSLKSLLLKLREAITSDMVIADTLNLFIVYCDPEYAPLTLDEDSFTLAKGLFLVRTTLTQSQIYHRIKRILPKDTAILVVEASAAPKFKGMAAGSTKWLRESGI